MGKPTGFLEYERKDGPVTAPKKRIENFKEFHGQLPEEEQRVQRRTGETGSQMYGMRRPVLPGGTDDRRDGKRLSSA